MIKLVCSLYDLIPQLKTAHLSDLSFNEDNEIIFDDKVPSSQETKEKVKAAFSSLFQNPPIAKKDTVKHHFKCLNENQNRLEFLDNLKPNSDLIIELFNSNEAFEKCLKSHQECKTRTFDFAMKKFKTESEIATIDHFTELNIAGTDLKDYTDDKQLQRSLEKLRYEMEARLLKAKLTSEIPQKLPLIHKQIMSLTESDRSKLFLFLENNYAYFNDGDLNFDIILIKKSIELFLSANNTIKNYKSEFLKKETDSFKLNQMHLVYELVEFCGSKEDDLNEIFILIKELINPGIENKVFLSHVESIIKELRFTTENTINFKKILSIHLKFFIDNKKLPPRPSLMTILKQSDLIEKYPEEASFLLKISAFDLLTFFVIDSENLKPIVKMLSVIPSDITSALMESMLCNRLLSLGFFKPYHQIIKILFALSKLPRETTEKTIPLLTSWCNKTNEILHPYILRLFTNRIFDNLPGEINQLLEITKKCSDLDKVKNEVELLNKDLSDFLFNTTSTSAYWEKCQKTLNAYPAIVKPFETWLSKLALLDETRIRSWPVHLPKTNEKFRDLLFRLFELESMNSDLFLRVLSIGVGADSASTLEILIDAFYHCSTTNFLAFLQTIELHPDLIPLNTEMFKKEKGIFNFRARLLLSDCYKLNSNILYIILKEKDPDRQAEIQYTFINDQQKLLKILEIDTLTPIIWQKKIKHSYRNINPDLVDHLLQIPASIKQKILEEKSLTIAWDQIPHEILTIEPELPLNITKFFKGLEINCNIRLFLEEAILEKKESKIYYLFKLFICEFITEKQLYTFLANLGPSDLMGTAFKYLFFPEKNIKDIDCLAFLKTPEWSEFSKVIAHLEQIYDIVPQGSIEERLKALPISWKINLMQLMHIGISESSLIKPMCDFILLHSQLKLFEFLITMAINADNKSDCFNIFKLFNKLPLNSIHLSINEEILQSPLFLNLLLMLSQEHLDRAPELLAHALNLPQHNSILIKMLEESPDLFFNMIELDKRLGPPYGKIISRNFDKDTSASLVSNPELAITVKEVGLCNIKEDSLKKLENTYLYMLQIHPDHPGIDNILSNQTCIDALKKIDWFAVSNRNKCISHILTVASWEEMDSLNAILDLMTTGNYQFGEHLLDRARCGYLPEVMSIIQDSKVSSLEQESVKALNATQLSKLEIAEKQQKEFNPQKAAPEALMKIKAYMEQLKKQEFRDEAHKEHAIEAAFSFALADSMITDDGRLTTISFSNLLSLMDFPHDSDAGMYLQRVSNYLERDGSFAEILNKVEISSDQSSPVAMIVRRMFDLKEDASLAHRHAKVAALSALLSRPRQSSDVGSCFGTASLIISQSYKDRTKQSLEDYQRLLADNALTRIDEKDISYSYPISMPVKKMKEAILDENLLLRAREKILASMGGNAKLSTSKGGLISFNLQLFEDSCYYGEKIEQFKDFIVVPSPLESDVILNELQKTFTYLTKTVVEYEEPHPESKELGWWYLSRRDKQQDIRNAASYQELHIDIVQLTRKSITALYRNQDQDIYLTRLFDYLEKIVKGTDFIDGIGVPKLRDDKFWMMDTGGIPEAVVETDLQYVGTHLNVKFYPETTEQVLHHLIHHCNVMPDQVKKQVLEEPSLLYPLSIPKHACCFKPYALVSALSQGKNNSDIIADLNKLSGIYMKDFDEGQKKDFMENWMNFIPEDLLAPFKKQIPALNLSTGTFEDLGKRMMGALENVYGLELPYYLQVNLENVLLKLLSPEKLDKISVLIIADLNWDKGHYNNCYLGCARSPLTGKLEWYVCDHFGRDRKRYDESLVGTGSWALMQPISRVEKGHLTYKKL